MQVERCQKEMPLLVPQMQLVPDGAIISVDEAELQEIRDYLVWNVEPGHALWALRQALLGYPRA